MAKRLVEKVCSDGGPCGGRGFGLLLLLGLWSALLFLPLVAPAQSGHCLTPDLPEPSNGPGPLCNDLATYVPDETSNFLNTPNLVFRINFHFMRPTNGLGPYAGDQTTNVNDVVGYLNWIYGVINPPTFSVPLVEEIPDSRIRFQSNGIYYHDDDTYYQVPSIGCDPDFQNLFGVDTDHTLNIYYYTLTDPNEGGYGCGPGVYANMGNGDIVAWASIQLLAHELGHVLSLNHTFTCAGLTCLPLGVSDTYGQDCNNTWAPCGVNVPYTNQVGPYICSGYSGVGVSNNLMGYNMCRSYLSPLQMAKVHRTAITDPVMRKYVICQPHQDNTPIHVTTNTDWQGGKILNADLYVEPGATLTIRCTVDCSPHVTIHVKQGGKLVLDGGTLTAHSSDCNDFWRGIEVWGTANQWQYDNAQHQGHLVLKNGARIEHAREGIQTMNPNDWTSTGGIVEAYGTSTEPVVFYNCRRAASFVMYENVNQNTGVHYANRSYFKYCDFIVDDDYRGNDDFYAHVSLWRVDGIKFLACNFENQRSTPGITSESAKLGQGILALDARFKVQGICQQVMPPGQICPPANWTPGTFVGLDHGIEARNSSTAYNFTVDRCTFTKNVCGVYANGVTGFAVRWCEFEFGDRDLTAMTGDDGEFIGRHRGIYTTNGYGFQIDDNYLQLAPNPAAPCEGIVIGYTRDHNDIAFHNIATGMEAAFVGEGICADPMNKTFIGLQYICNENLGNGYNIWNRRIVQANPQEFQHHTMRLRQGALDRPAANTFDRDDVNLPVESDLHSNTNLNTVFYFYHSPGNGYDPLDIDAVYFPKVLATTVPDQVCAQKWFNGPVIGNDPNGVSPSMVLGLNGHLSSNKAAYGNTRYLYDQLIDGGSTDEVVLEIMSTWPQDAWELRDYLLGLSPNLSTGALKEMVEKGIMPPAMIAEVCIANPDATRQDGFLVWLQEESGYPLPEYLADAIVASWDQQGYRFDLETTMGEQHARMTLAANLLVDAWQRDTLDQSDSLRGVWQRVRTAAARYAEALVLVQQGDHATATTVVENIPIERELEPEEEEERQRMLSLISFLQGVRATGRNEAQLTTVELDELEQVVGGKYDRPATWAQNLLCFGYGRCRAPLSGSDGVDPKSLRPASPSIEQGKDPALSVFPNPASTFCTLRHRLPGTRSDGAIVVQDAMGRAVFSQGVGAPGDLLWDVRGLTPGVYNVELRTGSAVVATERLVLKP